MRAPAPTVVPAATLPEPASEPVISTPETAPKAVVKKAVPAKSEVDKVKDCLIADGYGTKIKSIHLTGSAGFGLAEVFTSYTGGMMGPNAGKGKLIAGAFATCTSTSNGSGLVTIYDAGGEMLSNGNY
jgi:hypothetical protein